MYRFDASISSAVRSDTAVIEEQPPLATAPLDEQTLGRMHRYWQATNYLTVG